MTDLCLPDALEPVEIEEILAVAREAEGKLRTIVRVLDGPRRTGHHPSETALASRPPDPIDPP